MTEYAPQAAKIDIDFVGLYQVGFSLGQIADMAFVSRTTIRLRLIREGVEIRPRGAQPGNGGNHGVPYNELMKTVLLYRHGYSTVEIGEMLGLAHPTVNNRLRIAGEPIRDRSESLRMRNKRRRLAHNGSVLDSDHRP